MLTEGQAPARLSQPVVIASDQPTFPVSPYDSVNAVYGTFVEGKQRVSATPYTYDIAEGHVSGHTAFEKIGYNPALVADTEADLWSAAGAYAFPPAAMGLEVVSADNTQDKSTVIHGAMNGSVTADAGGTTTTLVDADVDFTGGTAAVAGDFLLLNPNGTGTPEWGVITTVAATTLTCAGGFSGGGTGASRKYAVVDKSVGTGAQVVKIDYLTTAFAPKSELVVLNGTTAVATVNTDYYRINDFSVVAAGTGNKPVGNLSLRETDDSPVYAYILAGYTMARAGIYTVPAGKTLYITEYSAGYSYKINTQHYARIYLRANQVHDSTFRTGDIFYPYTEVLLANAAVCVPLHMPLKFAAGIDLRVSAVGTYAGPADCVLRGWLEA